MVEGKGRRMDYGRVGVTVDKGVEVGKAGSR